jgi:ATP-dependent RNA helicase DeaD
MVKAPSGFQALSLHPALLDTLRKAAYKEPTPIQAKVIPYALAGRDVIGQAQTGTGKTAAFLLPFLHRIIEPSPASPPLQALVLAPTRELVTQVADEARKFAPIESFRCVTIIGGQNIRPQITALKAGWNMVVGSPGRVIDHINRGTLSLANVRYVVLDEADRMLDIGFRPDIERILGRCPSERQTLLLSATLPEEVLRLAQRYMNNPVHVNVTPEVLTVDKIKQYYITVDEDRKFELLLRLMERERVRQCIIFCQRKSSAWELYTRLREAGKRIAAMHGDLPQSQRDRIMNAFRQRKVAYLIATDIVGRGIDVTGISHVINYDLPDDVENYVHRIGRTGRMGKDGVAISFVTPDQGRLLTAIEATIKRLLTEDRIEGFEAFRPRVKPEPAPNELPLAPKPVYGRPVKRYSRRL